MGTYEVSSAGEAEQGQEILDTLDTINKYIAFTTFVITFITVCVLFVLVRCNLDKAAIVQVFIYLLIIITRCLEYIPNPIEKSTIELSRIIASHINWIMLYFMIFEMMFIKSLIVSENLQTLLSNRKRVNLLRVIVLSSLILFYSVPSILIFEPLLHIDDSWF